MGTTSSKTSKKSSTFSRISSTKQRASKRFLKHNSAVYPSTVPSSTNNEQIECNNNSQSSLKTKTNDESTVVIRKKGSDDSLSPSTPSSKKEKKKKKSDAIASGDEAVSTYHKTNICYYKVETGKYLKLPSDTKHKSNDGCYIKLSNGSFRHLMVPDGAGSRPDVSFKPVKDVRQSLPMPKISDRDKEKSEDKQPQNRRVMVTMIDGGLPVVAVSKRDRTSHSMKKEKDKAKVMQTIQLSSLRRELSLRWSRIKASCVNALLVCDLETRMFDWAFITVVIGVKRRYAHRFGEGFNVVVVKVKNKKLLIFQIFPQVFLATNIA